MRNVLALTVLFAGTAILQAQAPITRQTPDQNQPQTQDQAQHHHRHSPQRETRMMTRKLGLSPDQAAQVEPVLQDRQQRMEALHSNTSLTPQQMHEQQRAIMQDTRGKLDAILTEPQRQQLAQMQADHHHHGQQPVPNA